MDRSARLERIYETIRDIPSGSVASYGQIAELAGIPRGARQVGWALRQLPGGHDVPWHRVITASGRIAFAEGTAACRRQRGLLVAEGVAVLVAEKVAVPVAVAVRLGVALDVAVGVAVRVTDGVGLVQGTVPVTSMAAILAASTSALNTTFSWPSLTVTTWLSS